MNDQQTINKLSMNHTSSAIQTLDGRIHNLHNKVAADFEPSFTVELIAKVLSQNNRWNGNTIIPVNVAWHSIAVFKNILAKNEERMKQMTPQGVIWLLLKGLFHDAMEIVTGDTPRPYKQYLKDGGLTAENSMRGLDFVLEKACKLALLKRLREDITFNARYEYKAFIDSLEQKQELWDNLNTLREIVKNSDLEIAEIENWLWRTNYFNNWRDGSHMSTRTIFLDVIKNVQNNKFIHSYWYPIPAYVLSKQFELFNDRIVSTDLSEDSEESFKQICNKIPSLIQLFAINIKKGPQESGYTNPVAEVNYMEYFFPNYEKELEQI